MITQERQRRYEELSSKSGNDHIARDSMIVCIFLLALWVAGTVWAVHTSEASVSTVKECKKYHMSEMCTESEDGARCFEAVHCDIE